MILKDNIILFKEFYREKQSPVIFVMLVVLLLVVSLHSFQGYIDSYYISGVISLALLLPILLLSIPGWYKHEFRVSLIVLLGVIAYLYLLANSIIYRTWTLQGCVWQTSLLLFFVLLSRVQLTRDLHILYYALIAMSCYECILGLISYRRGEIMIGTFDNPAGLSIFLAMTLPFCMYLFEMTRNIFIRMIPLLVGTLTIITVILSESRTGVIGICFLVGVLVFRYIQAHPKYRKLVYLIGAFIFVGIIVILLAVKQDSAIGRTLIWQVCLDMIKDKPVFGFGYHGFEANYMNYQAEFLTLVQNDKYNLLADNVKHPFNEYLLLLINYGFVGFTLLGGLIYQIYQYYKSSTTLYYPLYSALGVLMLCSMFSYPLNYPAIVIFAVVCLGIMASNVKVMFTVWQPFMSGTLFILCIAMSGIAIILNTYQKQWYNYAMTPIGNGVETVTFYQKLYPVLQTEYLFLYNYAYLLVENKDKEAIHLLRECKHYFNDYDVEMLIGEYHYKTNDYNRAIEAWDRASEMCPNRFVCRYKSVLACQEMDENMEVESRAREILEMSIKVPSHTVNLIREEMEKLLKQGKEVGMGP